MFSGLKTILLESAGTKRWNRLSITAGSFSANSKRYNSSAKLTAHLQPLRQKVWAVYAKPPFGGPAQVIDYLRRCTHRVALSNDRIIAVSKDGVTFQREGGHQSRAMTLPAEEFIYRFLSHTLPPGFAAHTPLRISGQSAPQTEAGYF